MKYLAASAKYLILISLVISQTPAFSGSVDNSNCYGTEFVITGFEQSTGKGAHISTNPRSNGYGGTKAECQLVSSGTTTVMLLCYDGYINQDNHHDSFRLDLGPRELMRSLKLTIYRDSVVVSATKVSHTGFNDSRKPYQLHSVFPLRAESGFCREGTIYYTANGVLSGDSARPGSGFKMTVNSLN